MNCYICNSPECSRKGVSFSDDDCMIHYNLVCCDNCYKELCKDEKIGTIERYVRKKKLKKLLS